MAKNQTLSRRDFLRLAGSSLGALLLPFPQVEYSLKKLSWPVLRLEHVPSQIQEILDRVPNTMIARDGRMFLMDPYREENGWVPQVQTKWNRENSFRGDLLYRTVPWGIVLHWYGDRENFDKTITGYLRGFDSLREVDGKKIRTSAHFLVGKHEPNINRDIHDSIIGIVQTQKASESGTPYVASHISGLDYEAHKNRRNYFVRAQYQLGYDEPGVHSILQNWLDGGQVIDPNMRTIAIEMTGYDFESREHFPEKQLIANTISVIWALMRRYGITANNIFGHNEIQLNKPDPGKKFMGLIRYLVGAKALIENDPYMNQLVFGNFLREEVDTLQAVNRYFKFVYDYLLMISKPVRVYEWEGLSGYWYMRDLFDNRPGDIAIGRRFRMPLYGKVSQPGRVFTNPSNHEGADIYHDIAETSGVDQRERKAFLTADGTCIYVGEFTACYGGQMAIFRHRQLNGCQVLSVYGHLDRVYDLDIDSQYPLNYPIGEIMQDLEHTEPFLHFAMAYGGTWETDLKKRSSIPLNVGESWIRDRYQNPFILMGGGYGASPSHYPVT